MTTTPPDAIFEDRRYDLTVHTPAGVRDLRAFDLRVDSGTLHARLDTGADMHWPSTGVYGWEIL